MAETTQTDDREKIPYGFPVNALLFVLNLHFFGDTLWGILVRVVTIAAPAVWMIDPARGMVAPAFVWAVACLIETFILNPWERIKVLVVAFIIAILFTVQPLWFFFVAGTFAEWFTDRLTPPPE